MYPRKKTPPPMITYIIATFDTISSISVAPFEGSNELISSPIKKEVEGIARPVTRAATHPMYMSNLSEAKARECNLEYETTYCCTLTALY
jgi:hypothetical protein